MLPLIIAFAGGALLAHATKATPPSLPPPQPPAPSVRIRDVTSRETMLYAYQDVGAWAFGSGTVPLPYSGKLVPKGIVVTVRDGDSPLPPMFWGMPETQGWHYVYIDGDVAEALFGGPVEGFLPPRSLEKT